jgi:3-phytase
MTTRTPLALACASILATACASLAPDFRALPVVEERYVTARTPRDNVDSMSVWMNPAGGAWLLATAKETDRIVVYDAATGRELARHGESGTAPGQLRRPNGIFVSGDLAFVVERDNRRVQVFRLPGFEPELQFGAAELRLPYGLWIRELDGGRRDVYVSDAYEAPDEGVPPLAELGERMKVYRVEPGATGALEARHLRSFGDTGELGALRIVESLWGDVPNGRLLIAEEDEAYGSEIKVYDLDGRFQGRIVGRRQFVHQAEGIALWACPDGSGWWITTDQHGRANRLHLFDRRSLAHVATFRGSVTNTTDGIWLQQAPMPAFPGGALFASHADAAVSAFDWRDIARVAGIPDSCP